MVTTDMAKRRKTNKKQILIFAIIAVLFMVSVVITYFPGKVFPTWSSIYRYAGVNETASTDTYPFMVSYLDQTTPNMIQRISEIFERKPLISKEI